MFRFRSNARLVIVPHAPDQETHSRIRQTAVDLGLPEPVPLAQATGDSPLVLAAEVGRLAWLYAAGEITYVGGGWGGGPRRGGRGLHSVLEPAAWGLPVLVGRGWQESADAVRLYRAGAMIPLGGAEDGTTAELAEAWLGLLNRPADRIRRGTAARQVVEGMRGAADRLVELLEPYLVPPTITPS